jgi:hypothetical protein
MIFRPEMVDLIKQGKKRQERRETCHVQPGRSYAVQAGRQPATARITIITVAQQQLGAVTLKDARREGFRNTQEFRDYWRTTHKGYLDPDRYIWVITFILGDHTDQPRLLAARPGAPYGDYVTTSARAMRGEPEAIPAALQVRYAMQSENTLKTATNGHLETHVRRLHAVIGDIRSHAKDPTANDQLRGLERQAKALERKLTT